MKNKDYKLNEGGLFYSKWYFTVLMILIVTTIIGWIFSLVLHYEFSIINFFMRSILSTVVLWAGCMSIVTYCWSKFPWEQMPLKHLVIEVLLICLLLFSFIGLGVVVTSFQHNLFCFSYIRDNAGQIVISTLITFLITSIHEAVFFYRQWKLNFSKSISLERDNIQASYNMLKAQINPHFLFNSLNSLMSLVENNERAEKYIQELSEFLRYVLISNERELVSLEEELEYLNKYIYLQKIRFGTNLEVDWEIDKQKMDNVQIPPLVLQMLFDNCVKHNVITVQRPLQVRVRMDEHFVIISNNLQQKHTDESTGQGLKNIAGRLKLLTPVPLKVEKTETDFSVYVPLIFKDKR